MVIKSSKGNKFSSANPEISSVVLMALKLPKGGEIMAIKAAS
jgi:hypothetical protein